MYCKYGKPVHNSFGHFFFKSKLSFFYIHFGGISNKTIIQLIFVEYDMIIANLALHSLLAMYHIIIILCILWNNC